MHCKSALPSDTMSHMSQGNRAKPWPLRAWALSCGAGQQGIRPARSLPSRQGTGRACGHPRFRRA
eukprot:7520346-Alexandrium_andersonii.AAC.1